MAEDKESRGPILWEQATESDEGSWKMGLKVTVTAAASTKGEITYQALHPTVYLKFHVTSVRGTPLLRPSPMKKHL